MRYKLWAEMPDEQKKAFIEEYLTHNKFMGTAEELMANNTVLGILKTIDFEVRELDRPSQKKIITQDVPIGIIGVIPIKEANAIHITFHYIKEEYKGSFKGFYEYLLDKIKEWQYQILYFWCDARTSRFITRNAKLKAARFLHVGMPEEFELIPEEDEPLNGKGEEQVEETEIETTPQETQEPQQEEVEA